MQVYNDLQFLIYKSIIVYENVVINQIYGFQELVRDVEKKVTTFSVSFEVYYLLNKLSPSWSNVAQSLIHKQGELTITQVINLLRIEKNNMSNVS